MTADGIVWAILIMGFLVIAGILAFILTFYVPGIVFGCFFPDEVFRLTSTRTVTGDLPLPGVAVAEFLYPSWGMQKNPLDGGYLGCIHSQGWDVLLMVADFTLLMAAIFIPFVVVKEIVAFGYRWYQGK